MARQCPECGEIVNDNDRFCEACGAKLVKVCSECGEEFHRWLEVCPNCGNASKENGERYGKDEWKYE